MHIILFTFAALAVLYVLYRAAHSRNAVSAEAIGISHGTLPMRHTGLEVAFLSDGKPRLLFKNDVIADVVAYHRASTQLHPEAQEAVQTV